MRILAPFAARRFSKRVRLRVDAWVPGDAAEALLRVGSLASAITQVIFWG